jgi:hypothetical protein
MSEPLPSPADYKPRARPGQTTPAAARATSRDSLPTAETPPWLAPLDAAYKAKCAELEEAQAEVIRLKVQHERDTQRLRDARDRLENWGLRHATWVAERERLLAELRRLDGR